MEHQKTMTQRTIPIMPIPDPVPVTAAFVRKIRVGTQLFYYPADKQTGKSSAADTPSEYILYSVIDLPTQKEIVMVGAFDETEQKKIVSKSELLSGEWRRRP